MYYCRTLLLVVDGRVTTHYSVKVGTCIVRSVTRFSNGTTRRRTPLAFFIMASLSANSRMSEAPNCSSAAIALKIQFSAILCSRHKTEWLTSLHEKSLSRFWKYPVLTLAVYAKLGQNQPKKSSGKMTGRGRKLRWSAFSKFPSYTEKQPQKNGFNTKRPFTSWFNSLNIFRIQCRNYQPVPLS